MRRSFNIILFSSIIISTSCSDLLQEYDNENAKITINIDEIISNDPIYFSELFSNFKFIPLETSKNAIFSAIDNLKLVNDTIFIFDRFKTKSVFMFTQDGSFINKIQHIGRGPGEYIYPVDFDVDSINRTIAIFDMATRKLNFYTYEGVFLQSLDLTESFFSFVFNADRLYSLKSPNELMNKDDNLVYIFDMEGNVINQVVQFDRRNYITNFIHFFAGGHFYSSKNDVKFFMPYKTTILSINEKGIHPFISLNTNKYRLTNEELSKINEELALLPSTIGINKLFHIREYSENDKKAYFKFNIGMKVYHTFHYFISNKTISTNRLIDDLTFINPSLFQLHNDHMIGIINSSQLLNFKRRVASNKLDISEKDKARVLELFEIPDYNNPIIVLFDLK